MSQFFNAFTALIRGNTSNFNRKYGKVGKTRRGNRRANRRATQRRRR